MVPFIFVWDHEFWQLQDVVSREFIDTSILITSLGDLSATLPCLLENLKRKYARVKHRQNLK
jgi:hypothetical protein